MAIRTIIMMADAARAARVALAAVPAVPVVPVVVPAATADTESADLSRCKISRDRSDAERPRQCRGRSASGGCTHPPPALQYSGCLLSTGIEVGSPGVPE